MVARPDTPRRTPEKSFKLADMIVAKMKKRVCVVCDEAANEPQIGVARSIAIW